MENMGLVVDVGKTEIQLRNFGNIKVSCKFGNKNHLRISLMKRKTMEDVWIGNELTEMEKCEKEIIKILLQFGCVMKSYGN